MVFVPSYSLLLWALLIPVVWASDALKLEKRTAGGGPVSVEEPFVFQFAVRITSCYRKRERHHRRQHTEKCWTCTGSFLDRYGSVLAAAHCVAPTKVSRDLRSNAGVYNTTEWTLRRVQLTWGLSGFPVRGPLSETVSDRTKVKFHPESHAGNGSLESEDVDLAIIHLSTYYAAPMKFDAYIHLIVADDALPELIRMCRVVGFGVQPFVEGDDAIRFVDTGRLNQIVLYYSFQVRNRSGVDARNPFTKVFAAVATDRNTVGISTLQFKGTCEGDDGGPYLVKTGKEKFPYEIRGIVVRSHPVGQLCTRTGQPVYIADINYPTIRSWIEQMLEDRANKVIHEFIRDFIRRGR